LKPLRYFILIFITVLALVALDQIPLVQDLITASGYSSSEVIGGTIGVLVIFYSVVFALTVE
jgi:Na+/alanine symporter